MLPANSGRDFPKIIKHGKVAPPSSPISLRCNWRVIAGINDDGPMHPQSPHVSAPDGTVTLMYRMGREKWLERFLDVNGTRHFKLVMREEPWQDLYVQRHGHAVEVSYPYAHNNWVIIFCH
jgi:hypothetical protein